MKTESLNPWLIIRWSLVALIYAGTVAIAVDQVKTKDKELVAANAKIGKMKAGLANVTKGLDGLAAGNSAMIANVGQMEKGLLAVQSGLAEQAKTNKALADLSEHAVLVTQWTQLEKDGKAAAEKLTAAETKRLAAKTPTEAIAAIADEKMLISDVTALTERMKANSARRKELVAAGR